MGGAAENSPPVMGEVLVSSLNVARAPLSTYQLPRTDTI